MGKIESGPNRQAEQARTWSAHDGNSPWPIPAQKQKGVETEEKKKHLKGSRGPDGWGKIRGARGNRG